MANKLVTFGKNLGALASAAWNDEIKKPQAYRDTGGTYNTIYTYQYDGEKTPQSMGTIRDYRIAYERLRTRSWQAYLESDIAQTILGKYSIWVVGTGLKLESEPNIELLENEGIDNEWPDLARNIESRWKVWSDNELSSNSEMSSYNTLMREAFLAATIGGDCLIVHRVKKGILTTQVIDGSHIKTPPGEYGNGKIKHGVECDASGKHIAYHVETSPNNYERIPAYGSKGKKRMAFMVYGLKYRLDSVRGLPLLSVALQTISSVDRYKEAMVAGAESRAKIAYSIEHDSTSTGENPFKGSLSQLLNEEADDQPKTVDYDNLMKNVRTTVNNETINMPIGAKLAMHDSKIETHFDEFFMSNINLIAASVGIPPEVAMSMYNSNYSASRAAIKDWEHTLTVRRGVYSEQSYKRTYSLFYDLEVLKNKIKPTGYLTNNDPMVKAAFKQCRFIGANVPHIDPLKEVRAEREKLGDTGKSIPLTTAESATEKLSEGDAAVNMSKFARELERSKELGIVPMVEPNQQTETDEDSE